MSDESQFEWDSVPSDEVKEENGVEVEQVEDGDVVGTETTEAAAEAAPAKKPERRLEEEFPLNGTVRLIKSDIKGNYAVVVGHPDKANVKYVTIRPTHYKSGAPRPANAQKEMTVRPDSIERAEVPKVEAAPVEAAAG